MRAEYLIDIIEEFCKENSLDISDTYSKIAEIYQSEYGINIVLAMENADYYDMPLFLESLSIVERYVSILNGMKNCIKNS